MGVWGPRVAGLVGAGGVRRCVASRALSRSTARSEEKCARKALATEALVRRTWGTISELRCQN